jgi:hypothetical protein
MPAAQSASAEHAVSISTQLKMPVDSHVTSSGVSLAPVSVPGSRGKEGGTEQASRSRH